MEPLEQIVCRLVKQYAWLADSNRPLPTRTNLTALGLDSMNINSLVMDLERELDVALPDSMFTADVFENVETLTAALHELRSSL